MIMLGSTRALKTTHLGLEAISPRTKVVPIEAAVLIGASMEVIPGIDNIVRKVRGTNKQEASKVRRAKTKGRMENKEMNMGKTKTTKIIMATPGGTKKLQEGQESSKKNMKKNKEIIMRKCTNMKKTNNNRTIETFGVTILMIHIDLRGHFLRLKSS